MRLLIAGVGRAKGTPVATLVEDYLRRLPWPASVREVEVRQPLPPDRLKAREGELLLRSVGPASRIVALDPRGRAPDSRGFAELLRQWRDSGVPEVAFLIGGAEGHAEAVLARADHLLSLGPMTWPHLLVRAMLAEQLWRAHAILAGHPYHRD